MKFGTPNRKRRWLRRAVFWAVALLIVPCAILTIVEGILRGVGCGSPTSYFVPGSIQAPPTIVSNTGFLLSCFPPPAARPPFPAQFLAKKSEKVFRCFVFGESAAMGEPDPEFSFWRILETMLAQAYPGVRFEFINTAAAGINSHVIRSIARDAARYEPDLFLVYMGNNEVIGPWGPANVFQRFQPSTFLVRSGIMARSLRLGQAVEGLADRFAAGTSRLTRWEGLEAFAHTSIPYDDPRMKRVYGSYAQNLTAICEAGVAAGARVVACSVPSNVRDFPPLGSTLAPGTTAEQRDTWKRTFDAGLAQEDTGALDAAVASYRAAAAIDATHAELQYRLAHCIATTGDPHEAAVCFQRARDLDTLHFRADTRINATTRGVAARFAGRGVRFVDVEQALNDQSRWGVAGNEFFYEHVHLTFAGNYAVARAVFPEVAAAVAERMHVEVATASLSQEACATALGLTDWHRSEHLGAAIGMISRPPFTTQPGHKARVVAMRRELADLSRPAERAAPRTALQALSPLLEQHPERVLNCLTASRLLSMLGDIQGALGEAQVASAAYPDYFPVRDSLGMLLIDSGKSDEAIQLYTTLDRELASRQTALRVPVLVSLAEAFGKAKRWNEAWAALESARSLAPSEPLVYFVRGSLLLSRNETDAALRDFRAAVQIDPGFFPACNRIDELLQQRNDTAARVAEWSPLIERYPDALEPKRRLAAALVAANRQDDAIAALEAVVDADPVDLGSRLTLANLLRQKGVLAQAEENYRGLLDIDPDAPPVRLALAQTLDAQGRTTEAVDALVEGIVLVPASEAACRALDDFLKQRNDSTLRGATWRRVIDTVPASSPAQTYAAQP